MTQSRREMENTYRLAWYRWLLDPAANNRPYTTGVGPKAQARIEREVRALLANGLVKGR
jgi:hypothetical protein